jgi:hypothetical protein
MFVWNVTSPYVILLKSFVTNALPFLSYAELHNSKTMDVDFEYLQCMLLITRVSSSNLSPQIDCHDPSFVVVYSAILTDGRVS